jgi:streptogramin lyase
MKIHQTRFFRDHAHARRTFMLIVAMAGVLLSSCAQSHVVADGFSTFSLPSGHGRLGLITLGPDSNLWFAAFDDGKIGRMTPEGALTEYALPDQHAGPYALIAAPDGALWFTESYTPRIGRITTGGQIKEFSGLSSAATAITVGPDGSIWFSEYQGDAVGKITIAGQVTEFSLAPRQQTRWDRAGTGRQSVGYRNHRGTYRARHARRRHH